MGDEGQSDKPMPNAKSVGKQNYSSIKPPEYKLQYTLKGQPPASLMGSSSALSGLAPVFNRQNSFFTGSQRFLIFFLYFRDRERGVI